MAIVSGSLAAIPAKVAGTAPAKVKSKPLPPAEWTGTPEQQAFLERVLQEHIRRSKGPAQRDLTKAERGPVLGTGIEMRKDAAEAAGKLLAAANKALAVEKAGTEPDADAAVTIRISANSGYRDRATQEGLWRGYFKPADGYDPTTKPGMNKQPGYYNETAAHRSKLSGGAHGNQAVRYMASYIAPWIAAPGFSNHQGGIAIDFHQRRAEDHGVRNSKKAVSIWQSTWFFEWLYGNADKYGFNSYETEPWHWEYRGYASRSFKMTDNHMTAFSQQQQQRFENEMVIYLQKEYPTECAKMGEARMRQLIREGIERAKGYAIILEGDVGRYIEFMLALAPDFDESDETPWAKKILANPRLAGRQKLDRIDDQLMFSEDGLDVGVKRA